MLRTLGAAHLNLLADVYWFQTLQQTGVAVTELEHRDIAFYADLTTSLDPDFRYVYEWGAIATPFNRGRSQWANAELAEALLRKGLNRFPNDWHFGFQLGYNLMIYQNRRLDAAKVYSDFASHPDAPPHVGQLATRLFAESGQLDASRQLTLALRDFAPDEETRAFYEHRLLEIERERELNRIDAAVTTFQERFGRKPETFEELIPTGLLQELRQDPLGGEYFLDLEGRARATSGVYRLEAYTQIRKREVRDAVPEEYQ